jgi:glyceraldehyde 3-phosphate dehydrogenase
VSVRVGLNGFGRTGRALYRAVVQRSLDIEIVAVNDLGSPAALARLLRRDSVHGPFPEEVEVADDSIRVGSRSFEVLHEPEPKELPWARLGVDVAVEASGRFTARDRAAAHLDAGAGHVVVSAPSKGADATFVIGVNEDTFDPEAHRVVSNASCTTNCLVPMVKVLDDAFGVEQGFMTTVHAYTGDQNVVDGLHKDSRRARAAAINIVPTTTGAARATGLVMQAMQHRLDGASLRVPVPNGSITDLVALVGEPVTRDRVNESFAEAAGSGRLAPVLEYSEEPLVSTDVVGDPASCVFDSELTMASEKLVKVLGWYDNEWGYANRLAELALLVGRD